MKSVKFISFIVIIVIVGGALALQALTIRIPVGKVGVRIQQYSIFGKKGTVEQDFGPGWHRDLGPVDTWQLYDSTVQTLEMTKDPEAGDRQGRDDVKVQSADGYAISVDVTVKYRIVKEKANRLYQELGAGGRYKTIVRNEAESACMGIFGTMSTEDFYNPQVRRERAATVTEMLKTKLSAKSIEVISVLIRDVEFDKEYERKIQRKKLADQEVEVNKSEAKAEEKRGLTQVIEAETSKLVNIIVREKEAELITMQAETDLEIAKIQAAYEKYATEKQADADLVVAQKGSEGTRLTKVAEAEGERLRNEAIQGAGGSVIVALEAARNLQFGDIMVSTMDVDLLDVDAMATKLGMDEEE